MANIFQKVFNAVRIQTKSFWTLLGSNSFAEVANMPTSRDYLDSYDSSFLVYTCVKKIAEKVANTKFKLYKVTGTPENGKVKELKNHPALDLLAKVNPFTTKFEMLEKTQIFEELLGNSYWLKVRGDKTKKPIELWQLRPDRVRIVEDPNKIIAGYVYLTPNGTQLNFTPEDIIHFKQTNPKSDLYGQPTVKAAIELIQSSIFTIRWNKNFFYNQARPDGMLILKTKQTPAQMKELEKRWKDDYGGIANAHKTSVVEGDADYKSLNMTMREMEFSNLRTATNEDILAAFGVPKSIIGMQGMNRAEAEAQIYTFLSETIEPKVQRLVETLNEFLIPEYGTDLYLDFESPTPQDRKAIIDEYALALNKWLSTNEIREMEGKAPLDGGWDIYIPFSDVPMSSANEGNNADATKGYVRLKGSEKKYREEKEKRENDILLRKVFEGKSKIKLEIQLKEELRAMLVRQKRNFTKEQKKAWWTEHDKILTSDIKIFRIMTKQLFTGQQERAIDMLKSQTAEKGITKAISDLLDWETEKTIFTQISMPVFTNMISKRGKRAAKLIGTDFHMTESIKNFIDKKAIKFSGEVNDTTKERLNNSLAEGVNAGESIDELTTRVADVFKVRKDSGAEMIARTEVTSAVNEADIETYKQSGVVEKKEWLATMDDRTRETHAEVDGEVVGLSEEFSNGLKFPGDPSGEADEVINCRCTLLPVIEE